MNQVKAKDVWSFQEPQKLRSLSIKGLFGEYDYDIHFDKTGGFSILASPNGFGKTTILNIVRAAVSVNLLFFLDANFDYTSICVTFDMDEPTGVQEKRKTMAAKRGRTVPPQKWVNRFQVVKKTSARDGLYYEVSSLGEKFIFKKDDIDAIASVIDELEHVKNVGTKKKPYLWMLDNGKIANMGELFYYCSNDFIGRRIKFDMAEVYHEFLMTTLQLNNDCLYIGTDRMVSSSGANAHGADVESVVQGIMRKRNAIWKYQGVDDYGISQVMKIKPQNEQLRDVQEAVSNLVAKFKQRADDFRAMGLMQANDEFEPHDRLLCSDFPEDACKCKDLHVLLIYKHLLEHIDWCMEPMDDFAKRVKLFKDTMLEMFKYEDVDVTPLGLSFYKKRSIKNPVPLSALSSGEKSMIVLLGTILFGASDGTSEMDVHAAKFDHLYDLVIIDEPEISLHPSWQRALSDFCMKVHEEQKKDFVIATHSPTFVNGKWNSVIELARLL